MEEEHIQVSSFKDLLAEQLGRLQSILTEAHQNRVASLEQEVYSLRAGKVHACQKKETSGFTNFRSPSPVIGNENIVSDTLSDIDVDHSPSSLSLTAEAMVNQPSTHTAHTSDSSPRSRTQSPVNDGKMFLRAPHHASGGARIAADKVSPNVVSTVSNPGTGLRQGPPMPNGEPVFLDASDVEEEAIASVRKCSSEGARRVEPNRIKDVVPVVHDAPDFLLGLDSSNNQFSLAVPPSAGIPGSAESQVQGWQATKDEKKKKPSRPSTASGMCPPSPRVSFTSKVIDVQPPDRPNSRCGRTSMQSEALSPSPSFLKPVRTVTSNKSRDSTSSKTSRASKTSNANSPIKVFQRGSMGSLQSDLESYHTQDRWSCTSFVPPAALADSAATKHHSSVNSNSLYSLATRLNQLSNKQRQSCTVDANNAIGIGFIDTSGVKKTDTEVTADTQALEKRMEEGFCFEVWPVWESRKHQPSRMSVLMLHTKSEAHRHQQDELDVFSDLGRTDSVLSTFGNGSCVSMMMVHPSSLKRLFWDYLGFILLIYDFWVVPMELFDLPKLVILKVMEMVVLIYWTLEIIFSFFTGYRLSDGTVVMQPLQVAVDYIRTWLLFDVSLVLCQWLDLLIGGTGLLKLARVVRILRLARLSRVRRNSEIARAIVYALQSERLGVVFAIVRLMCFLAGVAHCIACCWYGLGCISGAEDTSWVMHYGLERLDLSEKYSTSLHWSLTQFTGSTETDIHPQNLKERLFTVAALLLGFLVNGSVVSSITCSLTRLQIINAARSTQLNSLKQYLFDNNISTKVALRVQRNAMYALDQQTRNTPEESIEVLKLVSEPQRIELHYEIHKPALYAHRFFQCYDEVNQAAMKRVTHSCMRRLLISEGDVLFSEGEIPDQPLVYFLLKGRMRYIQGQDMRCVQTLTAGTWICGVLLWTPWVHLGLLRASSQCSILVLDASQFQSIAALFQTAEFYPRRYAEELVRELNGMDKCELTDVQEGGASVRLICDKVFPIHLRCSDETTKSEDNRKSHLSRTMSRTLNRLMSKTKFFD